MKAITYTKYGSPDVVQLQEVEKPTPADDEVLIKVRAASLNMYDWHMLTADIFLVRMETGLLKPKNTLLGADIAGRIEAVGKNITQFKPGDEVFGQGRHAFGGFAEYVCARENSIALKPVNATFEEAAAVPMAGLTALQGLRDTGHIQAGQKVLINGASGGVGTFAVQIAKMYGAEVTAVTSTQNLDTARSIGADKVVDYTKENFIKNGQHYDLILSANGYHSVFEYKRALNTKGIFVVAGGTVALFFQIILLGRWLSETGGKKLANFLARNNQKDLMLMKELIETGKIKSVIDRRYPLNETADALRYIGKGHAKGKVVITVDDKNN